MVIKAIKEIKTLCLNLRKSLQSAGNINPKPYGQSKITLKRYGVTFTLMF
jgi:hypothetical protein